jgi:hypothetical protein
VFLCALDIIFVVTTRAGRLLIHSFTARKRCGSTGLSGLTKIVAVNGDMISQTDIKAKPEIEIERKIGPSFVTHSFLGFRTWIA